jgi:hypothetical protein
MKQLAAVVCPASTMRRASALRAMRVFTGGPGQRSHLRPDRVVLLVVRPDAGRRLRAAPRGRLLFPVRLRVARLGSTADDLDRLPAIFLGRR